MSKESYRDDKRLVKRTYLLSPSYLSAECVVVLQEIEVSSAEMGAGGGGERRERREGCRKMVNELDDCF